MTEILTISDLHLSDKPPSQCQDSYNDDLFTMLWEIVSLADAHRPDAIALAGDVFHSKIAHRTSHRTVQRMIEVIQAFPCSVFLTPGNHDLAYDRLESIHETQPFGVLLKAGALLLDGWAEDFPLYGVPWQMHWDQDCSAAFLDWRQYRSEHDDNCLLITHSPIYPPGKEPPYDYVAASTIASYMDNVGSCMYGHIHDYHGIYEVDGVSFCNQGSISRGSLQESDLNRRPAVAIWRSDRCGTDAFERIELTTAKSASEVFRLAEAVECVDYRDRLDQFLTAVGSTSVEMASMESVLAHVQSLNLSEDERRLAEDVLLSASHGELH